MANDLSVSSGSKEAGLLLLGLDPSTKDNVINGLYNILSSFEQSNKATIKLNIDEADFVKKLDNIKSKINELQTAKIQVGINPVINGSGVGTRTAASGGASYKTSKANKYGIYSDIYSGETVQKNFSGLIDKIKQSEKQFNKLTGAAQNYDTQIKSIIDKHRTLSFRKDELETINKDIQGTINAYKTANTVFNSLSKANSSVGKESVIGKLWDERSRADLRLLSDELSQMTAKIKSEGLNSQSVTFIQAYVREYQKYLSVLAQAREKDKIRNTENKDSWTKLASDIKKTTDTLKDFEATTEGDKKKSLLDSLDVLSGKATGLKSGDLTAVRAEYEKINGEVRELITLEQASAAEIQREQDAARALHKEYTEFTSKLVSGAFFSIGASFVKYLTMQFRNIIQYVVEIDDALTQVAIVTNNSVKGLSSFAEEATEAAKTVGAAVTDILHSVETWARLGYSLSDATNLASVTAMYSNVAATSVDDATSSLTAILKGFNISASEAENVVDELTLVGQKYAISASELGVALERGGAALYAGGNSLEQSIAIVAAGNAAIQNANMVGTAMKTLSARLRASKTELEEMGEDLDGVASSASKMRDEILALSGVDIMLDDETYKSTYQILLEISEVWDTLSDVTQANLLDKIAGKRGLTVVQSIITNIQDMKGAFNDASNAMGTAARANQVYLDSISGRMAILKTNIQQFAQAVFNADWFKNSITTLSGIVAVLTKIMSFGDSMLPKAYLLLEITNKLSPRLNKALLYFGELKKSLTGLVGVISETGTGFTQIAGAVWSSISPLGQVVIAITAITLAIKAIKAVLPSIDKARSLNDEHDSIQAAIDSINEKLETNAQRIRDINSEGPIDIVDKAEIDQLEQENALLKDQLETKIKLDEENRKQAQQESIEAAKLWLKNNRGTIDDFIFMGVGTDKARSDLVALWNTLNDFQQEMLKAGVSAEDETLKLVQNYTNRIFQTLDPAGYTKKVFGDIIKNADFKPLIDGLKSLDKVTAETFSDEKYKPLLDALDEAGIDTRDLTYLAESFNDSISSIRLSDTFYDISAGVDSAISSIESFNNVVNTQKDDAFKGYVDAYQKVAEEIANGRLNSNTFWQGMELFLGKDAIKNAGYDAAELVKQFEKIAWLYQDSSDSGATFVNYLIDHFTELQSVLGETVMWMNESGEIQFNWDEDSLNTLSQYLGITRDQLDSLMNAANNFGDIFINYDVASLVDTFKEMGVISDSAIALDLVEEKLQEIGIQGKALYDILESIQSMEGVESADIINISDDETIYDYLETIRQLGDSITAISGEELYVDATALTESLQELGYSNEAIEKYIAGLNDLEGVTITNPVEPENGEESISDSIEDAVIELENFKTLTTDINGLPLDDIQAEFSDLDTRIQRATRHAYGLQSAFQNIAIPTGFASGTLSAKAGLALTGETGPEIIWDSKSSRSMIVGLNGPEMHRFRGGETVFNSAETAQIFTNSVNNRDIYGSFASGTASITGTLKRISNTSTSSSGGSSSSYSGSSSSGSSGSSSSSSANNAAKSLADLLKMEANQAKEEIEARVDALKDEEDALKDAADAAKDLADAEKDALKNEYDIAKEAINNRIDAIEKGADDATDALDKEIERLKEQLVLLKETNEEEDKALKLQQAIDAYEAAKRAKTARVYTADKGWVWVADPQAVKSAKETLDNLYKEYARDDAEKAINDQIDAIEKEKDAIKEQAEEQKKILKELEDAWKEQLDKMDYTVEEYQRYIDLLNRYTEMSIENMSETISDFGNQVSDVMQLNTEAAAAKTAYETFSQTADAEIQRLNDLKQKWSEYASNVSKTLEEYNKELEYASKFSTMSFDAMSQAVEEYMTRVREAMRLNSQANGSKGYASGSTSIPSTGAKIVDEYGQELIVHKPNLGHYAWLEKGDGVVPADITRRLMALGTNPAAYLSMYARGGYGGLSGINSSTTNYNFGGDIVLNNVKDANSFFTEFEQEINLRQTR